MYGIYRRIISVILSVLLGFTACVGLLGFPGCAPGAGVSELFFYRAEVVEAEMTLLCNGSVSAFLYRGSSDSCRVEFTAPEELCGFVLETDADGGRVVIDGLTATAPDALCVVPNIARRIFTLEPDDVTSIETVPHPDGGEETVTAVIVDGIKVTLDKDGRPIRAEGVLFGVGFQAEITDFSSYPQEGAV